MFDSFFLAGFECTTGWNRHGAWIDQIAATQHDRFAEDDYALLRETGIRAARDGVRWPLVDRRGRYDFATLTPLVRAARGAGLTVVWDLFHFGCPVDVDPFAPSFAERFADYCRAATRHLAAETPGPLWLTPVNEPSYFAWAAGEAGLFAPHAHGRGGELKRALARAAILGIDAIRSVAPSARILNVDALCRVVPPPDRPDLEAEAAAFNDGAVFESWDMIAGRLAPELGGSAGHLGIVGVNYYWTNQWDLTRRGTPLAADDPRLWPLGRLVHGVHARYGADVVISETSHSAERRAAWVEELTDECELMLASGLPLGGVCLYPVLGMPEWHAPHEWTRMGLWDLVPQSPTLARVPYRPMHRAVRAAQRRLERRSRVA